MSVYMALTSGGGHVGPRRPLVRCRVKHLHALELSAVATPDRVDLAAHRHGR